ncbi:hypothetical protein Tco_1329828 [Tanacetum coccineum]
MPYPSRKTRRIRVCTHQRLQRKQAQYAVSRRPIRRIGYIVYEDSGRYQTWSLLQETPICPAATVRILASIQFRRISLIGFLSCASRSQTGASQSRQSKGIDECNQWIKIPLINEDKLI